MFTGLVQQIGEIIDISTSQENKTFTIRMSKIWSDIHIDESIAHNGVCLTVVEHANDTYKVTAIKETLEKTTASVWQIGDKVNLERAMKADDRLGGHFVQGHVDGSARCISIIDKKGSKELTFEIPKDKAGLIVEKGSITLNGISLTIFNITDNTFTVAIIPYTWKNTTIHTLQAGDEVNTEYDIIGKYMQRTAELYMNKT